MALTARREEQHYTLLLLNEYPTTWRSMRCKIMNVSYHPDLVVPLICKPVSLKCPAVVEQSIAKFGKTVNMAAQRQIRR